MNKLYGVDSFEEWLNDLPSIAKSLSRLNRYTGQGVKPLSVAEHSILLAQKIFSDFRNKELALALLVHDVHECVVSDVPAPTKLRIPALQSLEDDMILQTLAHFKINIHRVLPMIDSYDKKIRDDELRYLFPDDPIDKSKGLGVKIEFWSADYASANWLLHFEKYNDFERKI